MVKMLSLRTGGDDRRDDDRRRPRPAAAARRRRSALEGMDAFGLQEELEAFAGRLERALRMASSGRPVHENVTEPAEVPASFRRRIAEDNRLDMELYEHARELLSERRLTMGAALARAGCCGSRSRRRGQIAVGRGNAFVIGGYCYHPTSTDRRALGRASGGSRQPRRALRAAARRRLRTAGPGDRPPRDAYRSGFVALVDLAATCSEPERLEIELVLDARRMAARRPPPSARSTSCPGWRLPPTPSAPPFPEPPGPGSRSAWRPTSRRPICSASSSTRSASRRTANWICLISDDGSSDERLRAPAAS